MEHASKSNDILSDDNSDTNSDLIRQFQAKIFILKKLVSQI